MAHLGHEGAKYRRPKDDPGQQLTEDCGLADPAQDLAEQAAYKQKQDELCREDGGGVVDCHGDPDWLAVKWTSLLLKHV